MGDNRDIDDRLPPPGRLPSIQNRLLWQLCSLSPKIDCSLVAVSRYNGLGQTEIVYYDVNPNLPKTAALQRAV